VTECGVEQAPASSLCMGKYNANTQYVNRPIRKCVYVFYYTAKGVGQWHVGFTTEIISRSYPLP